VPKSNVSDLKDLIGIVDDKIASEHVLSKDVPGDEEAYSSQKDAAYPPTSSRSH
jgi:hypothetical protein